MARSAAAEVRGDHGLRPGPFAKNASRDTHRMIRRLGRYWKIPITELQFPILGNKGAHVESLSVPYTNPVDLFSFFLANHPEALWGGFSEPHEASSLLTSWWDGFKAVQPSHVAFAHHAGSLGETIPILLYGDEGRGRRRGNTAICSIEVPFGLETARTTRGGAGCACFCDSAGPQQAQGGVANCACTNLKEHSFITKFLLWVQPCMNYNQHPDLVPFILRQIALDLRRLFYEGLEAHGRVWCFALVGCKGDMKWHASTAGFTRYFGKKGRKRSLAMCYECGAGLPGVPYEDTNANAAWTRTVYFERPWEQPPPLSACPFEPLDGRPEFAYKKDPFHTMKLGLMRHFVGSVLITLIQWKLFHVAGESNAADICLTRAHSYFAMYCLANHKSPSLRKFSRALFAWTNNSTYPWANVKGSDSALLVAWLVCMLRMAIRDGSLSGRQLHLAHVMLEVGESAIAFYDHLFGHGLLLVRGCVVKLVESGNKFIKGYGYLAHCNISDNFCAWAMIPKLHSFRHILFEMEQFLASDAATNARFPSPLVWSCESNEDLVGRAARLSRRCGPTYVTRRVLELFLIKARIVWRRAAPRLGLS